MRQSIKARLTRDSVCQTDSRPRVSCFLCFDVQMFVKCLSTVCQMFVKCLSNVCQMFVKCLSNVHLSRSNACLSLECMSVTHVANTQSFGSEFLALSPRAFSLTLSYFALSLTLSPLARFLPISRIARFLPPPLSLFLSFFVSLVLSLFSLHSLSLSLLMPLSLVLFSTITRERHGKRLLPDSSSLFFYDCSFSLG